MKRRRVLLIAGCLLVVGLAFVLYRRVDRGPHDGPFPPIAHEYHVCDKCGSLDGGVYGKGPHKRFRTDAGGWCAHDWRPIDRAEFKQQAAERFGVDWSLTISEQNATWRPLWASGGMVGWKPSMVALLPNRDLDRRQGRASPFSELGPAPDQMAGLALVPEKSQAAPPVFGFSTLSQDQHFAGG